MKRERAAQSESPPESTGQKDAPPTPYGGQAVIEGVLMRGKTFAAVALRSGDGGIEVYDRPLKSSFPRWITEAPFVRGFFLLFDMMGLGMWALNLSSERYTVTHLGEVSPKRNKLAEGLIIALSLILAVIIFKASPTWIVEFFVNIGLFGGDGASTGIGALISRNFVEGAIRLTIFVLYVYFVGKIKEIGRVFEYHGAEHTVINAHESDPRRHDLGFISSFDTLHPRCGTSFIVIMVLLMIILMGTADALIVNAYFPELSWPPLWVRLISRIAVIPILSGISYEIIKHAYKFKHILPVKIFINFGMAFQRLTTRKPSLDELECGLASLLRVREVEEGLDLSTVGLPPRVKFLGEATEREPVVQTVGGEGKSDVE